jgi:hypothetical protein
MSRINELISAWPKDALMTTAALKKSGVSNQLINRYLKSGWIEKVGNGAYKMFGTKPDMFIAVKAMQDQLSKSIRIGGMTAFNLYSRLYDAENWDNERVYIFGGGRERLPEWFLCYKWKDSFIYNSVNFLDVEINYFLNEFNHNGLNIKISSPELAVLEMSALINSEQAFYEVYEATERMEKVSSGKIQRLLESSSSVKVNRLVLFMIEENQNKIFKELELSKVMLGSGKRSIVKGGIYNPKYKITVPAELNY